MRVGRFVSRLPWLSLLAALAALLPVGCGAAAYPDDLTYPPRADLLVLELPKDKPTVLPPPGHVDRTIARVKELGGRVLDPATVPAELRDQLSAQLVVLFGSPSRPTLLGDPDAVEVPPTLKELQQDEDVLKYLSELRLIEPKAAEELEDVSAEQRPAKVQAYLKQMGHTLAEGSRLYRKHCLHCHGLTGDGRGSTGPWLYPPPRDVRQGRFKFVSTKPNVPRLKPRREDLLRTLRIGVEGTSMPSFGLLEEAELEQLASYVVHLSIRGEIEFDTLRTLGEKQFDLSELEGGSIASHSEDLLKKLLRAWSTSNRTPMNPLPYPYNEKDRQALDESVRRGHFLFSNSGPDAFGCVSCHQDYGRQVPFLYDQWGTLVRPSNLTNPVYRGGRRPVDLYYRVRGGIPPAGMPAVDPLVFPDGPETARKLWDLVNFLEALPYPAMLPDDVRAKVYAPAPRDTQE